MCRIMMMVSMLFAAHSMFAAEWMQWRGPNHDGISTETGLLESWPEDGPKLLWKVENLGGGYSNLSFADNMIFSMGDFKDGCYLYALELNGGKEIWRLKVGDAGATKGNGFPGPRCTPATDGKFVFAIGQFGDFVCADIKTGKEYWRVNVAEQYGGFVQDNGRQNSMHWDFSMSPIIDGNRVVLPIGGENGTVICFEKSAEGPKVLWQSKEITDGAAYTSIVPLKIGGKDQYLLLTMGRLAGLNPENGQVLWQASFPGQVAVCSDPVCLKDGDSTCYIMCASGYNVGARGFKVTFTDGKFNAEEIWSEQSLQSHHGGMVRLGDHVYMLTQRELACVDPKTGKIVWNNRSVGKGSIFAVDGKLIVRSEAGDGAVGLVEATPDGYKEISRFDQPDRSDKNSWAYPVVLNGRFYLRDQGLLLCYELKQ